MGDEFYELEEQVMARMREIYSEAVIEHAMNPRNLGSLPDADGFVAVRSRCGELMKMWIKVNKAEIVDVAFWTDGCGATVACGSIATELIKGKDIAEALRVDEREICSALGGLPEGNYHCAELAANAIRRVVRDYISTKREPWRKAYRRSQGFIDV